MFEVSQAKVYEYVHTHCGLCQLTRPKSLPHSAALRDASSKTNV